MNDTSFEMEQLWRSRIMARAPEERFLMGLSMYDTAKKIVLSSLEEIKDPIEKKLHLFRRFYSGDFSDEQLVTIMNSLRKEAKAVIRES